MAKALVLKWKKGRKWLKSQKFTEKDKELLRKFVAKTSKQLGNSDSEKILKSFI